MDPKGLVINQQGLKMNEKGQNIEFWTENTSFLAEFSTAEMVGTPPPPLAEKNPLGSF